MILSLVQIVVGRAGSPGGSNMQLQQMCYVYVRVDSSISTDIPCIYNTWGILTARCLSVLSVMLLLGHCGSCVSLEIDLCDA